MDIPGLIRLLKPMLASVMAKRFTTCWWVYGPRLPDTLKILTATGSVYKGELLTWRKPGAFGLGKSTRKRFENMWYGTAPKGGLPIRAHDVDQEVLAEEDLPFIIEAPRRGDSVKPDEAYEALEQLYGDVRRLELFARCLRPGWTVWGNEIDLMPAAAD